MLKLPRLGDAGSKCPKCQAGIEKFVGMRTPIPVISKNTGNTDEEGEWSVKETERLATTAAGSDAVIVIHPLEDRPSPLYSSGHREILGDRIDDH
jgi:lactate dehydrogenase-like 2-hydroxyacid dehydrogenase